MSRANFCDPLQRDKADLPSRSMAKERPVFHADISADIREWRVRKGWSVGEAVQRAAQKGHVLTAQKLRWMEEGRGKFPPQDALRAVAAIYGLDYEPLAWRYVAANYGVTPTMGLEPIAPLDAMQEEMLATLALVPEDVQRSAVASLRTFASALETARRTAQTAESGRGPRDASRATPAVGQHRRAQRGKAGGS